MNSFLNNYKDLNSIFFLDFAYFYKYFFNPSFKKWVHLEFSGFSMPENVHYRHQDLYEEFNS